MSGDDLGVSTLGPARVAGGLALVALPLLLVAAGGHGDDGPLPLLGLLGVCAPVLGALLATLGFSVVSALAFVAALWLGSSFAVPDALGLSGLPGVWLGVLAALGLAGFGYACGSLAGRAGGAAAAALAGLAALSAALPTRGGLADEPLARSRPAHAARALDLSFVGFVVESAGVDWMRHHTVYEPAGTDWFSDRRRPWRGRVAAPLAVVLGWALAFACRRHSTRGAHLPEGTP